MTNRTKKLMKRAKKLMMRKKRMMNNSMLKRSAEDQYLYAEWLDIKGRCYDPNHPRYPEEGANGIKMCDEWLNDFEAFAKYVKTEMGMPPGWSEK